MWDSAFFDQAVAALRGLGQEIRGAAADSAGGVRSPALHCWAETVDAALADLLEAERRARYDAVFEVGAALADVTADGPPDPPSSARALRHAGAAVNATDGVEEELKRA